MKLSQHDACLVINGFLRTDDVWVRRECEPFVADAMRTLQDANIPIGTPAQGESYSAYLSSRPKVLWAGMDGGPV
jgi:hypothetical protein